ncbi:DUF2490 domain-containing protein [Flaviramulus sp. BrNp1-15]|uniref:DUF2490 domain-containing protein n=1 Tax=Flaviramulus sp. BrNp1-15 TaxID=2916754 RepID=UPI001EE85309|nr:DUF2490 domain-containing protein [Flaviramulus sp. BrNp1-15]ULC60750.1 DUF2490 domain-containing protein [Flaviramulus sp. BrNp1-15]
MKSRLLSFLLLITISYNYAQTNPENELGAWYTFSGNHKLSEKSSVSTLAQFWLYEETENFNFGLYNLGLNYKLSPKFTTTFALGYADIDGGFNTNKPHTYEKRISEQIGFKHKIVKLPIDHRFRAEQRFLHKANNNKTQHRLRYRFGTKISLNKTLFIRLHNEVVSILQRDINTENRFYSALGINVSKNSNLQLGYLNRKINGLNLHRLQVGLYIKTDHTKK